MKNWRLLLCDITKPETFHFQRVYTPSFRWWWCSLLQKKRLFEGSGEHGSTGRMSPWLKLPKHKVRAASRLNNNFRNRSGNKLILLPLLLLLGTLGEKNSKEQQREMNKKRKKCHTAEIPAYILCSDEQPVNLQMQCACSWRAALTSSGRRVRLCSQLRLLQNAATPRC